MNENLLTIDLKKTYMKEQIFDFEKGNYEIEEFLKRIVYQAKYYKITELKSKIEPDSVEGAIRFFKFKNGADQLSIKEFIRKNIFLSNFLIEGAKEIKTFFGSQVQIFLELEKDPEEDFEELFITIRINKSTRQAVNLLKKFDEEWFLKKLPETKGLLNITIETNNEF